MFLLSYKLERMSTMPTEGFFTQNKIIKYISIKNLIFDEDEVYHVTLVLLKVTNSMAAFIKKKLSFGLLKIFKHEM